MLKKPCSFTTVPDDPYTQFPDILGVQKEGTLTQIPLILILISHRDTGIFYLKNSH
jgi:hypothetical protein